MYLNDITMRDSICKLVKVYNDYVRSFNAGCKDVEEFLPFLVVDESVKDPVSDKVN